MSTVTVFGATGYTGSRIVTELLRRDHRVVGIAPDPSRLPSDPRLSALAGSAYDPGDVARASAGSSVVIVALRGVGPDGHVLVEAVPGLLAATGASGARLGVMGGAGSLHTVPGGPLLVDSPGFPPAARAESLAQRDVLDALRGTTSGVDWFYISPGASYRHEDTPHRTGRYRTGLDVLLADEDGRSYISAEDLAVAAADEIERPAHHRQRFTVAY